MASGQLASSVAGGGTLFVQRPVSANGGSASALKKEALADLTVYRQVVGAVVGSVRAMFGDRLRAGQRDRASGAGL